jgi:hypothetical protein
LRTFFYYSIRYNLFERLSISNSFSSLHTTTVKMHSTTLIAIAIAAAAAPALAAPVASPQTTTPAPIDDLSLQSGALSFTADEISKGIDIATKVISAGGPILDGIKWFKQQLNGYVVSTFLIHVAVLTHSQETSVRI